jgi:hypothetical protein
MGTKLTKGEPSPTLADATEMIWHKTTIRMYGISDAQLEELTAGYNSLHLVFFGICIGAAITLIIAFMQTAPTAVERPYYFATMVAMVVLSAVCGVNGIGNYVKANDRKKKLYQESIPIEK